MDGSGDCVFVVELLWTLFTSFCHLLPHPSPSASHLPAHPLSYTGPKLVRTSKKRPEMPKWPEIKQVTNIELHYKKANRLLSPVLQKIIGQKLVTPIKIYKTGISTIITRCELGRFPRGRSHIVSLFIFIY